MTGNSPFLTVSGPLLLDGCRTYTVILGREIGKCSSW